VRLKNYSVKNYPKINHENTKQGIKIKLTVHTLIPIFCVSPEQLTQDTRSMALNPLKKGHATWLAQ